MGQKSASGLKRCEVRYAIEDFESTRVTIMIQTDHGEERHEGFLADLSSSGVRVALRVRPSKGCKVEFHLFVPKTQLDMHSAAVVRWLQPRDGDSWWVGCELAEPIPDDVIEALAAANLLNRRRDPRYAISHPGVAKWELADEQMNVELVDYSKGGFCMLCQEAKHFPSERVMLLLSNGDISAKVPARVMWQRQLEHGYAVGCSFTALDGFVTFRDVVEPGCSRQHKGRLGKERQMSLASWVLITTMVLFAVKGIELIRDRRPVQRQHLGRTVIEDFVESIQAGLLGRSTDGNERPSDQG